jgi:hypothetical protein
MAKHEEVKNGVFSRQNTHLQQLPFDEANCPAKLALNHLDEGRKTTDIYREKDWKVVDEVQEAVIKLVTATNRKLVHP